MGRYVEGYVIPIKRKNVKAYTKMATWGRRAWMKHGALSYYECVADEFPAHGLGFKKMCKLKAGETVVFAYIVYKSKAHRNKVFKGVKSEMEKMEVPAKMPFDMKRFSVIGCKVLVRAN